MQPARHENHLWIVALVFLINFIVFYLTTIPLMDDHDVPWHLATGALLIETHQFPDNGPWSFANSDTPWYILSWLWDVILAGVEKMSGTFGVLIFTLCFCAALVAALTWRLLMLGIALPAVFFTSLLAALCFQDYVTGRPQIAGYALVLIFHMLLHNSRPSNRYGHLLWLPPLMVVWANTHGSFIAGFSVIGVFIIEAFFTKKHAWLRRLMIIGLACGVASLITPYGPYIALGALRSVGAIASKYTIEWLPFAFTLSTGLSAWLIVFILVSNLRGASVPIADKLLAILWLIGTMFAIRNGAIFIIVSAPYLAMCLDEQTRDLRKSRPLSPLVAWIERQSPRRTALATLAVFSLFVAAAAKLPHGDKIQSPYTLVNDVIDYALEHYPAYRFLTDYNFGGQVIYLTRGKLQFFMDSRAGTAYSDQAMQDYIDFMTLRPNWEERMATYGINGIIVKKTIGFAKAYDEGLYRNHWKLVFAGKNANVYIARP